jgi:hypothetical protein
VKALKATKTPARAIGKGKPRALTMATVLLHLERLGACSEAVKWAKPKKSIDGNKAWRDCPRGDWLLWLAARAGVERKVVALAACACARLALKWVTPGEDRPLKAIETTERWARGEPGVTLEDVKKVRSAAYAAYAAAAAAAYDAADAAADAADAAAYAADAAAYAAYADAAAAARRARKQMQKDCADAVRAHIPLAAMMNALATGGGVQ